MQTNVDLARDVTGEPLPVAVVRSRARTSVDDTGAELPLEGGRVAQIYVIGDDANRLWVKSGSTGDTIADVSSAEASPVRGYRMWAQPVGTHLIMKAEAGVTLDVLVEYL